MNTYIVYVKSPNDSIVYDKRFDAANYVELEILAMEYFKYIKDAEVVRVEEVLHLYGDMKLHFGANFIKAVK